MQKKSKKCGRTHVKIHNFQRKYMVWGGKYNTDAGKFTKTHGQQTKKFKKNKNSTTKPSRLPAPRVVPHNHGRHGTRRVPQQRKTRHHKVPYVPFIAAPGAPRNPPVGGPRRGFSRGPCASVTSARRQHNAGHSSPKRPRGMLSSHVACSPRTCQEEPRPPHACHSTAHTPPIQASLINSRLLG